MLEIVRVIRLLMGKKNNTYQKKREKRIIELGEKQRRKTTIWDVVPRL